MPLACSAPNSLKGTHVISGLSVSVLTSAKAGLLYWESNEIPSIKAHCTGPGELLCSESGRILVSVEALIQELIAHLINYSQVVMRWREHGHSGLACYLELAAKKNFHQKSYTN